MNAEEVLKHLETIRRALYSGQISAAKVDAQRAFESLCAELGTVPKPCAECAKRENFVYGPEHAAGCPMFATTREGLK